MISIYFKTEDFDECLNKCKQVRYLIQACEDKRAQRLRLQDDLGTADSQPAGRTGTSLIKALQQFEQLFQQKPTNYGILSQLILIYIRNGNVNKAQEALDESERAS